MIYPFAVALLFAVLLGESARAQAPAAALFVAIVTFVGILISLVVPTRLFKFTNGDHAAMVLTRLMQRGALGSFIMVATLVLSWLLVGRLFEPGLFGEIYLFALIGIFLFQGFGGVITAHVMYLQQTHQYNSNQLVAVLLGVTLLLFTLILYFLAFDLARPPELHAYFRNLTAITLTLLGYGRAVYLMAHH